MKFASTVILFKSHSLLLFTRAAHLYTHFQRIFTSFSYVYMARTCLQGFSNFFIICLKHLLFSFSFTVAFHRITFKNDKRSNFFCIFFGNIIIICISVRNRITGIVAKKSVIKFKIKFNSVVNYRMVLEGRWIINDFYGNCVSFTRKKVSQRTLVVVSIRC